MDNLEFTEEEIQEQLEVLGYKNIPKHRLRQFKKDLDELIKHGDLKHLTSPAQISTAKFRTAMSQPSPPAYIKEKDRGEGFFLHAREVDHGRQVSLYGRDTYAQHSVAPKLPLLSDAPSRLQVEPDPDDTLHHRLTDNYTSSPDTHGRCFIKRKVLRKHNGQTLICDESVYSEDSESPLEERLADLHLSTSAQHETESEDETSQSDTQSSETEGISTSAFESYIRGMTKAQSDADIRPKHKSFIRPVISQQTTKKTDPVAKYFQYKQLWDMFKLPGERDRRALRLEIKERLAYQPPPPKPRRVYVPNTYIVPTEKKRSALRWEIRNDLANGLLPYKFNYRF
uniref:Centriolar and ciliogenesis-associated protein HYLS1 C-terminal domain-containing protein n=1 Tax=Mola mola TaxID=94237 RepID=A0A3Q3WZB3_MOLML